MGDYLFYKANGQVTDYRESFPESSLTGNYVNVPNQKFWRGRELKYWKVVDGVPTEMTQQEKDAVDAAEAAALLAEQQAAVDRLDVTIEDVLVALVKRINIRIPSNPITKQEVIDQIKADKGI